MINPVTAAIAAVYDGLTMPPYANRPIVQPTQGVPVLGSGGEETSHPLNRN